MASVLFGGVTAGGKIVFEHDSGKAKDRLSATVQIKNSGGDKLGFKLMTNDPSRLFVKPSIGVVEKGSQANVGVTLLYDEKHHEEIVKKKIAVITYSDGGDWSDADLSSLIKKNVQLTKKYELLIDVRGKDLLFDIKEEGESVCSNDRLDGFLVNAETKSESNQGSFRMLPASNSEQSSARFPAMAPVKPSGEFLESELPYPEAAVIQMKEQLISYLKAENDLLQQELSTVVVDIPPKNQKKSIFKKQYTVSHLISIGFIALFLGLTLAMIRNHL